MAQIKIYASSWCSDCRAAKRFLSEKNIPYEEINIEVVDGAAEIVNAGESGRRSVPTFDIDGQFHNDSLLRPPQTFRSPGAQLNNERSGLPRRAAI